MKETQEGERRVALTPEGVEKLAALGYEVVVEPDAGAAAEIGDREYTDAGATLEADELEAAAPTAPRQPPPAPPPRGRRRRRRTPGR